MDKYKITIKTKDGQEHVYTKEDLSGIDLLLELHPDYQEVKAEQVGKKLVKTRKVDNGANGRV